MFILTLQYSFYVFEEENARPDERRYYHWKVVYLCALTKKTSPSRRSCHRRWLMRWTRVKR